MILSLPISKTKGLCWILAGSFILLFLLQQPAYLNTGDLFFWLGLVSLPLSFKIRRGRSSSRFLWFTLAFAAFSFFFPTTFGIYCVLLGCILTIIEQLEGKTNLLFLFHLLLLSPLFQYFNSLVSFPIRLALSSTAGEMLRFAGFNIEISGNLIQLDGADFLVDSACSGLFMLRYSFLFAILILAKLQSEAKEWDLKEIAGLLAVLFFLNISGNLVRIVILIVFKIMPESWFHDLIGLCIFLNYSILPFYFLAAYWLKKKENHPKDPLSKRLTSSLPFPWILALLLLSITSAGFKNSSRMEKEISMDREIAASYKAEKVNGNVYKLRTEKALIYLKPPVEAYNADHNPLICWKGSGYEFKHITTTTIGELEASTAELIKGKDTLYTMWWFDSGKSRTGSQWSWRWRSLSQKEDFYLVNITAGSQEALREEARKILTKRLVN